MNKNINIVKKWYNDSYKKAGLNSQRRYPNEEFVRFLGRNFFKTPLNKRKNIRILELGFGSCANIRVLKQEGFHSFGLDISSNAVSLSKKLFKNNRLIELKRGSMTEIPYENNFFDAVIDVFSSYCLNESDFRICLKEVSRVLKKNGVFFSYSPGKGSDSFKNIGSSNMIDSSTLDGISRKDSPYPANNYPFRFITAKEYKIEIEKVGLKTNYLEKVTRSYNNCNEIFEFITIEGVNS